MIKLFSIFPKKKDSKWAFVFGFIFASLLFVFSVAFHLFSDITDIKLQDSLYRTLLLVFISSIIITLPGYLGSKLIPLLTSIGVLTGFIALVFFLNRGNELSGLVGSIVYSYLVLISLGISLLVELLYSLYSK